MSDEFYSTAGQIIVVLLLALSIEHRASGGITEKSLFGYVSRIQQVYVYVWGILGLGVTLLHLAGFNFGWFNVGKVTVLVSIFAMLILLVSIHIMGSRKDELQKRGYAVVMFNLVPTLLIMGASYLQFFSDDYIDMILINVIATIIMACSFIVLFRNRSYMMEVKEVIGGGHGKS